MLVLFKKQPVGIPWRMANLKMNPKQWQLTEGMKITPQFGYMPMCNNFQSVLDLLQTQDFTDFADLQLLLTWCLPQSPWESCLSVDSSKTFWEKVISFPWDTHSLWSLFLWWLTRLQSCWSSWCELTNRSMKAAKASQCYMNASSQPQSCASLALVFASLAMKRTTERDREDFW